MLIILVILILVFGFGGYRLGPGIGYYGGVPRFLLKAFRQETKESAREVICGTRHEEISD
jgi:hypothetical protein